MSTRRAALLVTLGLGACATPGQVRRVETQVAVLQREQERRDSARADELSRIIAMQGRIIDSLAAVTTTLGMVKGELSGEFVEVRRQLLTVQTLQGQSQARLSELRAQIEARQDALETVGNAAQDSTPTTARAPAGTVAPVVTPAGGAGAVPSADQIFQQSQAQLNRGSAATARAGFRELLRLHPLSPRVADAMFGIGQSFEGSQPDSALVYFRDVAQNFPESERAPQAMFKLGDAAQRAGDLVAAKQWFTRVAVDRYRGTSEHDLAVARLRQLP
jgi:TolA-binding protein